MLPYLLYLQGGPGFECQRPTEASGWIHKASEEYRVILMDQVQCSTHSFMGTFNQYLMLVFGTFILAKLFFLQRGTGLSTPLTPSSMLQFKSPEALADHLKHFRADSIVNDAEFIRVRLVPDAGPWTILGQVFMFLSFSMSVYVICQT